MDNSAQIRKKNILITNAASYLGSELASFFLAKNYQVYGIGKSHIKNDLILDPNFTLLDLNLTQPLPAHLPQFDIIAHIAQELSPDLTKGPSITPVTNNFLTIAHTTESKVLILAPINTDTAVFEHVVKDEEVRKKIKVVLVGDLYGPDDPNILPKNGNDVSPQVNFSAPNELEKLLTQALSQDKIILEKDGAVNIYPTYIKDAVRAIEKVASGQDHKLIHFVVSESPKAALTVSYQIQSAASIILSKDLGLFFKGPQLRDESDVEATVKIHEIEGESKTKLEDGFKDTFETYLNKGLVTQSQPEIHKPQNAGEIEKSINQKAQTIVSVKSKKMPLPFDLFFFKSRGIKKIPAAILLFLILVILKTALDVFLGIQDLKKAQQLFLSQNFDQAAHKADLAQNNFHAASNKINLIARPLKLIIPTTIIGLENSLDAAETASGATAYFIRGSKVFVADLAFVTAKNSTNASADFETPAVNFQKSYFESAKAQNFLKAAEKSNFFKPKVQALLAQNQKLNEISQASYEVVNLMPAISANGGKKTYLILLQNNTELRPGGGFIGNYGTVSFDNGRLTEIKVDDIYNIDGQLKEVIQPPAELTAKLGVKQLYLRDSNWSADNETNAQTARDFYKKETGQDVDGVITIDLSLIQNILKATGPIKPEGYSDQITAENLFEKGEYYAEIGFTPGSTQKRDFFGALSNALIAKIVVSLNTKNSNTVPIVDLFGKITESIFQKHLMFSFDDQQLATYIKTKGWNHPLPPVNFDPADDTYETHDFLALSEANLGANKVNRMIDRRIDYEMTIGRDADLVAKLKITYTNKAQANTWPAGTYVNFLRVYAPRESSLFAFKNDDSTKLSDVQSSLVGNLNVFSTYIEVPTKSTKTVEFTYRIPKNIQIEKAPTYRLYIEKQPGTDKDPLTFTFNLPAYLVAKALNGLDQNNKQNVNIQTDLSTDRQFIIDIAKK